MVIRRHAHREIAAHEKFVDAAFPTASPTADGVAAGMIEHLAFSGADSSTAGSGAVLDVPSHMPTVPEGRLGQPRADAIGGGDGAASITS